MSNTVQLDDEERELLDSYERGEWQPIQNEPAAIARYQEYAMSTLEESGVMSILVPQEDLNILRKKAAEVGMSSQTLITDILHLYVSGQLVEKPRGA
ncbi:MAG: antitoxin [Anaerolineae bacterium]|nr:antitoxin [Anaerolineae bacterium]